MRTRVDRGAWWWDEDTQINYFVKIIPEKHVMKKAFDWPSVALTKEFVKGNKDMTVSNSDMIIFRIRGREVDYQISGEKFLEKSFYHRFDGMEGQYFCELLHFDIVSKELADKLIGGNK